MLAEEGVGMAGFTLSFNEVDASMVADVGGKGANLGELSRIGGVSVPDGFCVTTAAYRRLAADGPVADGLVALAEASIPENAARLRDAIAAAPVPPALEDELRARLAELGEGPYAVRSSATAEDLPGASFAGQQDTYLNVAAEDVMARVRRCWASLFNDRAVAYRARNGATGPVELAVVVQRMVFGQVSGVMFTADPVTSNRLAVVIEAGYGLGEAMVSGLANADGYQVAPTGPGQPRQIGKRLLREQAEEVVADPNGGTRVVPVDAQRRTAQKLDDSQIMELAAIGKLVEDHFGRPQDIEWSLVDGAFQLVQSRPITTLFPIPGPQDGLNRVYLSFGHQQMMTDALTPLGLDFFQLQLGGTPLVTAAGRMFIDLTPDLRSPMGRPLVLASMRAIDPLMDGPIREIAARKDFMSHLAPGGKRYFSTNGAGYFTWRLPVETAKLIRANDPAVVTALRAEHDADLADVERRLASLDGAELIEAVWRDIGHHLEEVVTAPRSMAAVYAGTLALNWLNKRLEKWLGMKGAGDKLVEAGADDVTSQMGLELLDVADAVREAPEVLAALPGLEDATFFADLEALPGGAAVATAIKGFLERYGMRCPGEIDVTRTRWSESPSSLAPMILGAVRNLPPGGRAEKVEESRLRAVELESEVLADLVKLPRARGKIKAFRKHLSRMRNFIGYREYPKYLMMRHYWLAKQAILKVAGKLAAEGAIDRVDDVYYLTCDELLQAVKSRCADRGTIARRRADHAAAARLSPPRVITSAGEVPAGSYAGQIPPGALPGIAACPGVVEGRARVVAELGQADLEPGDILVTAFTDPSWTPLFFTISGVVTEVGGAMTHGAVVARECGLPAVVGVEQATRLIRDGQRIRVDGDGGFVELVDQPE
jgi:pyruvate,water dikinase